MGCPLPTVVAVACACTVGSLVGALGGLCMAPAGQAQLRPLRHQEEQIDRDLSHASVDVAQVCFGAVLAGMPDRCTLAAGNSSTKG